MAERAQDERRIPVLVSDFDGTMTRNDFYRVAIAELVPPSTPDFWDEYLTGRKTHFEALCEIFTRIPGDEETVMRAVRKMDIDPELGDAIRRLERAGWEIVIASAGCNWYIRRLLSEQGVSVTLHANPGELAAGRGLVMTLPTDSPYFSPTTGIDKAAVVKDLVQSHDCVAFAGDGPPDLPAALLVPPEHRFARGWLAEKLREENVPFRTFDRWSEIVGMLLP
ncbi:MAG: HAD-IB family phosphatase [Armatimonadota bacterium]